jgi:hypothetical protein
LIAVTLIISLPAAADPAGARPERDSLLGRLQSWIVRAFDYSGLSFPPG